jgi:hypothetical protein
MNKRKVGESIGIVAMISFLAIMFAAQLAIILNAISSFG